MYGKKLIFLTIIFLMCTNIPPAFSQEIDSLKNKLQTVDGIEKLKILNELAGNYWELSPNERIPFAEQMVELSEKLKDQGYKADAYNYLGIAYNQLDETQKSMDYFMKALDIAEQTNDKDRIAKSFLNLGQANFYLDHYDKAQEYFLRLLEIRTEIGDKQGISMALNQLGTVMARTKRYDKALDYFSKSLTIRKEINYKMGISQIYNNIANVYFDLEEMDKVLVYRLKSLEIVRELDNKWEIALSTYNIAEYYLENNEPDTAFPYLSESQELAEMLNNQGLIRDNTQFFSWYYELKEDYIKALKYLKDYSKLTKKQFSEKLSETIAEMQIKYETEKKEQEIELLTKDTEIKDLRIKRHQAFTFALVGLFVLVILIGFLWFSKMKEKQKREKIELEKINLQTEQKLLRAQINPHFMFNALNSVQSYLSANDNLKAMSYLAKFSLLMRNILDNSRKPMITLEDEINTLKLYIELESMRFKNAFDFEINIHPKIVAPRTYIPPMLIQPFVENSIKHGFRNLDRKGKLIIDFYNINGLVSCSIEDNGIGRKKATELSQTNNNRHKSLGMQVINERLNVLSKAKKITAKCEIKDLIDTTGEPSGTRVLLDMPYELE